MTHVEPGGSGLENRRPMSPHLQIYRPTLTMIMSISHRITGIALYFGTLLLAWLLIAASASPPLTRQPLLVSIRSLKTDLVRFTGLVPSSSWRIRHIIWDTGHGFAYPQREWLAQATLIGGIVLTVGVWGIAYLVS